MNYLLTELHAHRYIPTLSHQIKKNLTTVRCSEYTATSTSMQIERTHAHLLRYETSHTFAHYVEWQQRSVTAAMQYRLNDIPTCSVPPRVGGRAKEQNERGLCSLFAREMACVIGRKKSLGKGATLRNKMMQLSVGIRLWAETISVM